MLPTSSLRDLVQSVAIPGWNRCVVELFPYNEPTGIAVFLGNLNYVTIEDPGLLRLAQSQGKASVRESIASIFASDFDAKKTLLPKNQKIEGIFYRCSKPVVCPINVFVLRPIDWLTYIPAAAFRDQCFFFRQFGRQV